MISIIIPVYNKLDNLRAVLECLISQTEKNFEVIISDDGSSEDIVTGIIDIIDRIDFKLKYLWQADLGFRAGQARNNGVKVADGEILLFLDQDIIFPKNFIFEITKNMKNKDFLIYRMIQISLEEKYQILELMKKKYYNFDEFYEVLNEEEYKKMLKIIKKDKMKSLKNNLRIRKKGPLTQGQFAVRKSVFSEINGFDEEFTGYGYEDNEISNRLYLNKFKGGIIEILTIHLFHPSLSTVDEERLKYNRKLLDNKINNNTAYYGLNNRKDSDEIIYKVLK